MKDGETGSNENVLQRFLFMTRQNLFAFLCTRNIYIVNSFLQHNLHPYTVVKEAS